MCVWIRIAKFVIKIYFWQLAKRHRHSHSRLVAAYLTGDNLAVEGKREHLIPTTNCGLLTVASCNIKHIPHTHKIILSDSTIYMILYICNLGLTLFGNLSLSSEVSTVLTYVFLHWHDLLSHGSLF